MRENCLQAAAGAALLLLATTPGCGLSPRPGPGGTTGPGATTRPPGEPGQPGVAPGSTGGPLPPAGSEAALAPRPDLPPERRALLMVDGQERPVDAEAAAAAGYTLVDLSDGWTPPIFQTIANEQGLVQENRYRRIFVGLANDRLDDDGVALAAGERNYLELYGIPPSLSVLRERFLGDKERPCEKELDPALLQGAKPVRAPSGSQRRAEDVPAILEIEKRLRCEDLIPKRFRHQAGAYDEPLREVMRVFQQKHMIYETPYYLKKTLVPLSRPFLENDHAALKRVLTERVVAAAGVLEDGSVEGSRNLVEEFAQAAIKQLGLETPEAAMAFFQRHGGGDFQHLRAAVRLPQRPDYYAPHMDLQVVVDRGDVWYDLPYNEKGDKKSQPRERYPSFSLIVEAGGKKIPLVRWRTTVGGWRSEQAADGYEYYRYKGSDVGPRVIRHVISGPVWIAPESTPIRTLVKGRRVEKTYQSAVNYDEIGPGFRSAYGLVAGYFVVPGENGKSDFDNGIRAHGSAEYLSINSSEGFSHGCHRLLNHLAVRLYSFVLAHRTRRVLGDQSLGYERHFLLKDQIYELRIPSKGFVYQLDPPMKVTVLEGRIKGERKKPFTEYVPKPGVVYPGPPPPLPGKGGDDRAGGSAGDKEAP